MFSHTSYLFQCMKYLKNILNQFHSASTNRAFLFKDQNYKYLVGPPGVEPGTNGLCLPTMAFTTPFGFVVWTVSCLYDLPVQSLHVLSNRELRSGLPRCFRNRGFPEFEQFYQGAELTYSRATHLNITIATCFRQYSVKSAALTKHELEAHILTYAPKHLPLDTISCRCPIVQHKKGYC